MIRKETTQIKKQAKDLNRHFTKEGYWWQIRIWKYVPHLMSSGKLKQDTTIHLLEWLEYRTLTTPIADKDVEQQELLHIPDGNAKWYSHFGRQFDGFLQN